MKPDELEKDMRALEYFHGLHVPADMWKIIRLDGRTFSKLTLSYSKPFDLTFRDRMVATAKALVTETAASFAVTHSDEISLLFRPEWTMFDNELEKLVSSTASIATAEFNFGVTDRKLIGKFDSRVIIAARSGKVLDYFNWRQADSLRCAINGIVFWHMVQEAGMSNRAATSLMERKNFSWKNEYLFQNGINFNSVPRWQKRGVGVYWQTYTKDAVNKHTGEAVKAERRRLATDVCLTSGTDYAFYIGQIMDFGEPIAMPRPSVLPKPEMLTEQALMV